VEKKFHIWNVSIHFVIQLVKISDGTNEGRRPLKMFKDFTIIELLWLFAVAIVIIWAILQYNPNSYSY
jgi:hypothetical protein